MTYRQYNVYAVHTDVLVADLGIRITLGNPQVLSSEDFQASRDLKHLISVGAVAYRLREVAMKPKTPTNPPVKVVQPPYVRDPNVAWIRKPNSTPVFQPSNAAKAVETPSSLVEDLAALREQQEVLHGYLLSQQRAQQGQIDAQRQMREELQRQHAEILAVMAENQQKAIENALAVAALHQGNATVTQGVATPVAPAQGPHKEAVFIPSRITPEGESADVSNLTVQETKTTADVSSAQKALKKARSQSQKKVEDHGDD